MDVQSGESFKNRDATSYDPVAGEYDALIERYSGALAQRMLSLVQSASPLHQHILDVGTGTGIVALAAAQLAGSDGSVLGVDLSEGMLARAQRKAEERGLTSRVQFRLMDAERLALPDDSFDAVVSLFALHHFPNPLLALGEMRRVLHPGGVLCLGVGSGPNRFTAAGVIDGAVQLRDRMRQRLGRQLRAPQFIESLVSRYFPAEDATELTELASHGWKDVRTVPELVRAAGFANVRTAWLGQRRVIESADAFWELQRVYSSTARKRLAMQTPDAVESLRRAFFTACQSVLDRGGELVYSYAALYVIGERPQHSKGAS